MQELVLARADDVVAALDDPALEPPRVEGSRPTVALRAAMARFSGAREHPRRRNAVVEAIDRLDPVRARELARELTAARLTGGALELHADVGRFVPTETLATLLGAGRDAVEIVADVEAVVRVIGRGEPAGASSDAATDRLRARFADHPFGWVPAVSILYQGFDATMWSVAVAVHARAAHRAAVAPVPRTRRIAVAATSAAGRALAAGDAVVLEIGEAGLPFGSGPHRCPGASLAEHMVSGVLDAIDAAGFVADVARVEVDADGRPTVVPLVAR